MNLEKFCKAFMAGMFFPALLLALLYTMLYCCSAADVTTFPVQFVAIYVPLLFGLTNVLYLFIGDRCPINDHSLRLWMVGATLGLLVAVLGVFCFNIPQIVLGSNCTIVYTPLVLLPVIYGLIFRYIIDSLNKMLKLSK